MASAVTTALRHLAAEDQRQERRDEDERGQLGLADRPRASRAAGRPRQRLRGRSPTRAGSRARRATAARLASGDQSSWIAPSISPRKTSASSGAARLKTLVEAEKSSSKSGRPAAGSAALVVVDAEPRARRRVIDAAFHRPRPDGVARRAAVRGRRCLRSRCSPTRDSGDGAPPSASRPCCATRGAEVETLRRSSDRAAAARLGRRADRRRRRRRLDRLAAAAAAARRRAARGDRRPAPPTTSRARFGLPDEIEAACRLARRGRPKRGGSSSGGSAAGRSSTSPASGSRPPQPSRRSGLKGRLGALAYPLGAVARRAQRRADAAAASAATATSSSAARPGRSSVACSGAFGGGASSRGRRRRRPARRRRDRGRAAGAAAQARLRPAPRRASRTRRASSPPRAASRRAAHRVRGESLNVDGELVDAGELDPDGELDRGGRAGFDLSSAEPCGPSRLCCAAVPTLLSRSRRPAACGSRRRRERTRRGCSGRAAARRSRAGSLRVAARPRRPALLMALRTRAPPRRSPTAPLRASAAFGELGHRLGRARPRRRRPLGADRRAGSRPPRRRSGRDRRQLRGQARRSGASARSSRDHPPLGPRPEQALVPLGARDLRRSPRRPRSAGSLPRARPALYALAGRDLPRPPLPRHALPVRRARRGRPRATRSGASGRCRRRPATQADAGEVSA